LQPAAPHSSTGLSLLNGIEVEILSAHQMSRKMERKARLALIDVTGFAFQISDIFDLEPCYNTHTLLNNLN
jgi:hypothetical protein